MIKIRELENDLTDVGAQELGSVSGAGPIAGGIAAGTTMLGIGIYGLLKGQSIQSVHEQQLIFGGTAFLGGFFTPGP